MAPNLNLRRLREAGVSIWLDTLSRELLNNGGLAELIRNYGVTGALGYVLLGGVGVVVRVAPLQVRASNGVSCWGSGPGLNRPG